MTKRFTPKASDFTALLADTQKDISRLRAQLAELEAKERNLKGYLSQFFDYGTTEVDYGDNVLVVTFSETERKKLPQNTVNVLTFKVKAK